MQSIFVKYSCMSVAYRFTKQGGSSQKILPTFQKKQLEKVLKDE